MLFQVILKGTGGKLFYIDGELQHFLEHKIMRI